MARAACSESTGRSRSGSPLTRSITSSPPTTSDSLLASASVLPACSAASVGARPADADQPVHDEVGFGVARDCSAASGPTINSTPLSGPSWSLTSRGGILVGDRDERREELPGLPDEQLLVRCRPRTSPTTLNRSGLPAHDVERLGPDRPGRAEDGELTSWRRAYPERRREPRCGDRTSRHPKITRNSRNVAGATNNRESIRSSTPPWPGQERAHVLDPDIALQQRTRRDRRRWLRAPPPGRAASASSRRSSNTPTNDVTKAADATTVVNVPRR